MSEVAILPTTRDEAWRYADADWLAAADPVALAQWQEIAITAGDSSPETSVVTSPGVTRLRIHIRKGARYHHAGRLLEGPSPASSLGAYVERPDSESGKVRT